jgi:hypothetical protein
LITGQRVGGAAVVGHYRGKIADPVHVLRVGQQICRPCTTRGDQGSHDRQKWWQNVRSDLSLWHHFRRSQPSGAPIPPAFRAKASIMTVGPPSVAPRA